MVSPIPVNERFMNTSLAAKSTRYRICAYAGGHSGVFQLPDGRGYFHVWSAAELQAKNERDRLVCAHVYGLGWSEESPGQDGMRYALFPFTTAVLEDFVRVRV